MTDLSQAPDIASIEIPIDRWTEPFWEAAANRELVLPRCGACGAHRWPPGPFCPECRSQAVDWVPAGPGRLYSYTVVRQPAAAADTPGRIVVPGLVEFPEAGGVRIMAAIVDCPIDALAIDAPLTLDWVRKGQTQVPVFAIATGA